MQGRLLSGMEVEAAQVALAAEAQGLSPTSTDGSSPSISRKKTSHRRRYLSLIAQKGAQMMLLLQTRSPDAPPLPQGWLGDAWALLAAAAVQFRRCAANTASLLPSPPLSSPACPEPPPTRCTMAGSGWPVTILTFYITLRNYSTELCGLTSAGSV